jgi:hypothetical protein
VAGDISTWAVEDEAMEFIVTENDFIDYKFRYRRLYLKLPETTVNIPMLFDYECAYHNKGLTFNAGYGWYGREGVAESRSNFVQYKVTRWLYVRGGFFLPTYGLGTNDHSLKIKRNLGLGRGQETYNIETYLFWKKYSRLFITASAPSYRFSSKEPGLYEIITPYNTTEYRVKWGFFLGKKTELGLSALGTRKAPEFYGAFLRTAPFGKKFYGMFEIDYNRIFEETVSYARLGYLVYRGFDIYYEYDASSSELLEDIDQSIGVTWNIRPRFQVSFKINFESDKAQQFQYYGWL